MRSRGDDAIVRSQTVSGMEMEDLSMAARLARRNQSLAGNNINKGDPAPGKSNGEDREVGPRLETTDSTIVVWAYGTVAWYACSL